MYKSLLLVSALICVTPAFSSEKPEAKDTASKPEAALSPSHSHSICDNITQSLSHLEDEKAKGVITAFCALSSHGDASYVDKLQVTINIQGNDAIYKEKNKYKDNYGTKNKYTTPDNPNDDKPSPLPVVPEVKDDNGEKGNSDKPGGEGKEDNKLDTDMNTPLEVPPQDTVKGNDDKSPENIGMEDTPESPSEDLHTGVDEEMNKEQPSNTQEETPENEWTENKGNMAEIVGDEMNKEEKDPSNTTDNAVEDPTDEGDDQVTKDQKFPMPEIDTTEEKLGENDSKDNDEEATEEVKVEDTGDVEANAGVEKDALKEGD